MIPLWIGARSFSAFAIGARQFVVQEAAEITVSSAGAIIRDQVEIGDRAVIMMGAIINIGAVIKEGTMIDMGAVLGGRAIVGKNCHIGAGSSTVKNT